MGHIDPWLAIMIACDGVLVGSRELGEFANKENLKLVPSLEVLPRMAETGTGEVEYKNFLS